MLRADALHSATDVLSALVVWVGIRIAGRSSRNFPYGLYEVEKLVVLGGKGPGFVLGNSGVITRLADTGKMPKRFWRKSAGIVGRIVS